jgi:small subunit ribosomal protein S21
MVRKVWAGVMRQPFGVASILNMWRRHPKFTTKTIMVENNDVDHAFQLLNKQVLICQLIIFRFRMMDREGLLKIIRNTMRFQKPYIQRQQMSMDASRAIVREDMSRKIKFLSRKNRVDAYPGQITQ